VLIEYDKSFKKEHFQPVPHINASIKFMDVMAKRVGGQNVVS
jgi:hypothetical protein